MQDQASKAPSPIKFETQRFTCTATLNCKLPDDGSRWIAWWYGGLRKNSRAHSQPLIAVVFRKLLPDGSVGQSIVKDVDLTLLGQVRIGTIWEIDRCRAKLALETKDFIVDFHQRHWRYNSFNQAAKVEGEPPFPPNLYPLKYKQDRNTVLEFGLTNYGKLVIPCLEFFSRCYGRSQELKRVLATYPWRNPSDPHSRLYAPLNHPEVNGKWQVAIKGNGHLVTGDARILAWAKYDDYAQKMARRIYSQIEAAFDPSKTSPTLSLAHIEIGPWFQQAAQIRVSGIPFDDGRSFLALNIIGCSSPIGPPITLYRHTTEGVSVVELGPGNDYKSKPKRTMRNHRGQELPITSDQEPDHSGSTVDAYDPDFVELSHPTGNEQTVTSRKSVTVVEAKPKNKSNAPSQEEIKYASGDPNGDGKDVDQVQFHAPVEMESEGTLKDMWEAFRYLHRIHSDRIHKIEWFTFDDGYQSAPEPHLIQIEPFEETDEVEGSVRTWPYLDPQNGLLRGALVIRIHADEQYRYIVEIQRRLKVNADGELQEKGMSGLCFVLDQGAILEPWLRHLLSEIRHKVGVFKKVVLGCPGFAEPFSHRGAEAEQVACEAAARNALKKCGIKL